MPFIDFTVAKENSAVSKLSEKLHMMKARHNKDRLQKVKNVLQDLESPATTNVSFLLENLKVLQSFLQHNSCPGPQAVSRSKSIVKSNSVDRSPGWLMPREYYSQLHLGDWP